MMPVPETSLSFSINKWYLNVIFTYVSVDVFYGITSDCLITALSQIVATISQNKLVNGRDVYHIKESRKLRDSPH